MDPPGSLRAGLFVPTYSGLGEGSSSGVRDGRYLRGLRRQAGMTIAATAELIERGATTLQCLETGRAGGPNPGYGISRRSAECSGHPR
ncbi:helix-turn-helix domain-containing protein [Nocardia vinacea]|uniref:helix-turn-helix domain-containing protein n=1 Tax=Nocardia vinacea TaxID=96468 RepID=UPI00278C7476|nr:helix-turn-helix transcriptional regulator [Nocardia vinacea]